MSRSNQSRSRSSKSKEDSKSLNSRHEDSSSTDDGIVEELSYRDSNRGRPNCNLPSLRSPPNPAVPTPTTNIAKFCLNPIASTTTMSTPRQHSIGSCPSQSNDELTLSQIGFDATSIPNWSGIEQPAKTDLFELLKRMILGFEKTNVEVRIADTTFNCHMLVLQCYSEFFADLTHEQLVILPVDKVTVAAFTRIYEWMLTAEPLVQRDGILELFNAAQYLRIKGLVAQCWVCLDDDERFSEAAAFMLYLEARALAHADELIQRLMLNRVGRFFLTLVASREFVDFGLAEVCRLLQSNSIAVNAETEVLMAAIRWLGARWEERRPDLLAVMKCVRFGLMNPWQLVELKRNVGGREIGRYVESADVQRMVDDALSYVTTKYWYSEHTDTIQHYLERLQFTEPLERQWIHDPLWYDHVDSNQMVISYAAFADYLRRIRLIGQAHWRSLRFCDGNPHAIGAQSATAVGRLTGSVWSAQVGHGEQMAIGLSGPEEEPLEESVVVAEEEEELARYCGGDAAASGIDAREKLSRTPQEEAINYCD